MTRDQIRKELKKAGFEVGKFVKVNKSEAVITRVSADWVEPVEITMEITLSGKSIPLK